jgi:hypothetical protein
MKEKIVFTNHFLELIHLEVELILKEIVVC